MIENELASLLQVGLQLGGVIGIARALAPFQQPDGAGGNDIAVLRPIVVHVVGGFVLDEVADARVPDDPRGRAHPDSAPGLRTGGISGRCRNLGLSLEA